MKIVETLDLGATLGHLTNYANSPDSEGTLSSRMSKVLSQWCCVDSKSSHLMSRELLYNAFKMYLSSIHLAIQFI